MLPLKTVDLCLLIWVWVFFFLGNFNVNMCLNEKKLIINLRLVYFSKNCRYLCPSSLLMIPWPSKVYL